MTQGLGGKENTGEAIQHWLSIEDLNQAEPVQAQTQAFTSFVNLHNLFHISEAQFLHLNWAGRCVCGDGAVNRHPPPRPIQPACALTINKAQVEVNMPPLLLLKQILNIWCVFMGKGASQRGISAQQPQPRTGLALMGGAQHMLSQEEAERRPMSCPFVHPPLCSQTVSPPWGQQEAVERGWEW